MELYALASMLPDSRPETQTDTQTGTDTHTHTPARKTWPHTGKSSFWSPFGPVSFWERMSALSLPPAECQAVMTLRETRILAATGAFVQASEIGAGHAPGPEDSQDGAHPPGQPRNRQVSGSRALAPEWPPEPGREPGLPCSLTPLGGSLPNGISTR